MSTNIAAPHPLDTDAQIVDAFVRRGIFETTDFHSFWSQFVGSLTCELHRLPNDDQHLRLKAYLAVHWLRAFLCNFYEDSPEMFYWQPGRLRQSVYLAAMDLGVQILPVYPYSPAPDPRKLPESLFTKRSALPGVNINLEKCCDFLRALAHDFHLEYDALPAQKPTNSPDWTYFTRNGFYDGVDGCLLYAMIRRFRPRRIVEIGSGNSTYLAAQTVARNREDDPACGCSITAIEPYPNPVLRAGFPGLTRLVPQIVQEVPLSIFEELAENDILFIDSSHVLRTGSDVAYEFLEILPRLAKGVIVHIHDIFLPRDYPRDWVLGMNRYWTEQYLLQAFLAFNQSYEVIMPTAYLHALAPEALEKAFSGFQCNEQWIPASFWMQKIR